ncbi:AcrR family transcriptional regulator [Kitasatospora sp. MAP12-15]|uniref:TetR family transcriptional regulator n=1 Tax=unclassified Kitasatospora TaxID=2633591 RepID=UPI002474F50B|nr:TetR family transcriptional regulator [Kitasatospora sp. MAP12-44]MDH6114925.1 AcrR family transcriptional regulator [Kitasatospora sp. MAP12-44]
MSHIPAAAATPAPAPAAAGVRQAQKQQSRRALLDAGLLLLEHQNLSSLGVREVTRTAGMSPAGFYRHFRDLDDLGVALVEESLLSLHGMIKAVLAGRGDADELIDRAVEVVAQHVREHPAHVRFLARERHGGVQPVRAAITAELDAFTTEVAAALGLQEQSASWSEPDLRMLSGLYVEQLVSTAMAFLEAPADQPEAEQRIAAIARDRLRLISLGRLHWPTG